MSQERVCYRCKQPGHLQADCPAWVHTGRVGEEIRFDIPMHFSGVFCLKRQTLWSWTWALWWCRLVRLNLVESITYITDGFEYVPSLNTTVSTHYCYCYLTIWTVLCDCVVVGYMLLFFWSEMSKTRFRAWSHACEYVNTHSSLSFKFEMFLLWIFALNLLARFGNEIASVLAAWIPDRDISSPHCVFIHSEAFSIDRSPNLGYLSPLCPAISSQLVIGYVQIL